MHSLTANYPEKEKCDVFDACICVNFHNYEFQLPVVRVITSPKDGEGAGMLQVRKNKLNPKNKQKTALFIILSVQSRYEGHDTLMVILQKV